MTPRAHRSFVVPSAKVRSWWGASLWVAAVLAGVLPAQAPRLRHSAPADGATDVAVDVGKVVFEFDVDMDQRKWSFCEVAGAVFPPQVGASDNPWKDARRCELALGRLEPGTTYAVQLNSERRRGFRSSAREPLPVTVVRFTTARAVDAARGLEQRLVGEWLLRSDEVEFRATITADGRWSRTLRTAAGREVDRGTWRLDGTTLRCRDDDDGEEVAFAVKMPDDDTLELRESQDSGVRLQRVGRAPARPPAPARTVADDHTTDRNADRNAAPATATPGSTAYEHPLVGYRAQIPDGYWARLQGQLFSVEAVDGSGTTAFVLPMRPRPGATVAEIAAHFAQLMAQAEPRLRSEVVASTGDRVVTSFTSFHREQEVEGRTCTVLGAGGSMAFVLGIMAPRAKFQAAQPQLEQIARSFGFVPPRGRWVSYQGPAGGFQMTLPPGFVVESSDGRSPKDDIDWVAYDPQKPLSRAFQWCPRVCSPSFLQDPLHAVRGYVAGGFADHRQAVTASLGQLAQGVRLRKMSVNPTLTTLFRGMLRDVAAFVGAVGASTDVVVYDCLADAELQGQRVVVAFLATLQTMSMRTWTGDAVDWHITLRGWCAEPGEFVRDTPVLERACASMQLSAAFLRRITDGNEQAVAKIRATYDTMNDIDRQIRDRHWDTMDAIAEMNYDALRDHGGYVNEHTGRIEQIAPDKVVKNAAGEFVSREEFERGVPLEQCTVLRAAASDDYMRGVFGRIEFGPR